MRKGSIFFVAIFFFSCQKNEQSLPVDELNITQRKCAADEVLKAQLAEDPTLAGRMDQIEAFTKRVISNGDELKRVVNGKIEIPVVVHVLYNKPQENISDAQIQSQIDVLNEDFNLRNNDNNQVPSLFSSAKADVGVKFVLSQTIRKETSKKSWPPTDGMKYSNKGGSNAVDPAHSLNVW